MLVMCVGQKTAQWVEMPGGKLGNLNLMPIAYMVKAENWLLQTVL